MSPMVQADARARARWGTATPDERFWSHVDKTDGCWLWTASLDRKGYGEVRRDHKLVRAHRVAYELTRGPIPSGLFACHTCDVRACVNPDHLFLGTTTDNIRDAAAKDRLSWGEARYNARLTRAQVVQIRALLGSMSIGQLARQFGVSWKAIQKIARGETWTRA